MSTKSTIAHGENFHFYHEVLDDDYVYLELETTQFEVRFGRVMLPIPIHIWESIRHLGGAQMDLADKQDNELLAMVESEVDQRIAEYQQAIGQEPDRAGLLSFIGCLPYGGADSPRTDQVHRGMEYFQHKRQRQREVRSLVAAIRKCAPTAEASGEIMGGTSVFPDTRVPVQTLLDYLKAGDTIDEFLRGFPTVTREHVIAFLERAATLAVQDG